MTRSGNKKIVADAKRMTEGSKNLTGSLRIRADRPRRQMNYSGRVRFACVIAQIIALGLPLTLVSLAKEAPPAQPFQRLDGCIYKPQRWDDGDSFHVILPDKREVIFRLYFVDTPEEKPVYPDRIATQAAYFGITPDAAIQAGHAASGFTMRALAKPFTIQTRWRLALGRSKLPRYYAMVTTAEGSDLNELLVSARLARIYGTRTPSPDGRDSPTYLSHLAELEAQAKAAKRGAWALRRIGG